MDPMYAEIGGRIKQAREERGWTQTQLGEAIGYSQATIGNYELGRRQFGVDDLYRIADALGKPFSYFTGTDKLLEAQARRAAEALVRSDMAAFVGVRMLPVIQKPIPFNEPLSEDDISGKIPLPREFGERADLAFLVPPRCGGVSLVKGDYVFIKREDAKLSGQIVLVDTGGVVELATFWGEDGYEWTATHEPVKQRISVIGEFCGLFTENRFIKPADQTGKKEPGWADLSPEDQEQVRQFVEFLRARRSPGP
jgi:repressor LexA